MTEQFCSYETSLLLKQCGFHETVRHYYAEGQPEPTPFQFDNGLEGYDDWNSKKDMTTEFGPVVASAPTQSLALRWLREEHHIHIAINVTERDTWKYTVVKRAQWVYALKLMKLSSKFVIDKRTNLETFEGAADWAIRTACDYIIKQKEGQ